jgi:hypothetical protein
MIRRYLLSAPKGDIPLGPGDLKRPFRITPSEEHPFLTLQDYFHAIEEFMLRDRGKPLLAVLRERLPGPLSLDALDEMAIRSEKHGAFYHMASVDILCRGRSFRIAVSTAVTEKTRAWLDREFDILRKLYRTSNLAFLPRPYFKADIEQRCGAQGEMLTLMAAQWFEAYHEWHLSAHEASGTQRIRIWDHGKDLRFASDHEAREIFRQAAFILTRYYDTLNFSQIYPWHHAAGDFVVRTGKGEAVDVRLTTARKYEPFMAFLQEERLNPLVALIYFFLNLTVRMRLDRLEGVGETAWAEDFAVEAAALGFFQAIHHMEEQGGYLEGSPGELLSLLKGFDAGELQRLFDPLLDLYAGDDTEDLHMIRKNLITHVKCVYRVLQGLPLQGPPGVC